MDEEEFFEEEEIEEAILNEKEKTLEKEKNNKNKDKKNKSKNKIVTKNKTKVKKEKIKDKNRNKKNKQREIIYRDKGHPILTFFLVLIIMCLLCAVGYLVYENYYKEKEETNAVETNVDKKETPKEKEQMSEEEALMLGTNLYNSAYELYNGRANFSLNTEDTVSCDEETCSLISNFDSVTNNIFTESAKKEFERNAKTIRKIDGKFYYIDNFSLDPNSYIETNFEISKINDDKITFKAISDYCVSDEKTNCQNKENETKRFVIVKENNKWLVDEFVNPVKE